MIGGKKDKVIRAAENNSAAARCKRTDRRNGVAGNKATAIIADGKLDIEIRKAVIERGPVCAAIGGKKDTAVRAGKNIAAAYGKRPDMRIRETVVNCSPVCSIICRAKDTAVSPDEDAAAAHGKRVDGIIREARVDVSPAYPAIGA